MDASMQTRNKKKSCWISISSILIVFACSLLPHHVHSSSDHELGHPVIRLNKTLCDFSSGSNKDSNKDNIQNICRSFLPSHVNVKQIQDRWKDFNPLIRNRNGVFGLLSTSPAHSQTHTHTHTHTPAHLYTLPISTQFKNMITGTRRRPITTFQKDKEKGFNLLIRGGASTKASEEEENEDDDESEDEEETEEEEENNDEEEESEEEEEESEEEEEESKEEEQLEAEEDQSENESESSVPSNIEYDTMLMPSPMQSMGVTIGVMLLTKRLDLTNQKVIQFIRYTYLSYVILSQVFFAYVRIVAKQIHDTTPITISNPLTNLVKSQLNTALETTSTQSSSSSTSSSSPPSMAKTLTNKFLSSQSTIMEYDINQSRKLGSGMIFSLIFMWFLHFKMNQIQPLLFQTASGILNLVYSPLFQVYILGRNLERPFTPPTSPGFMGAVADADTDAATATDADADTATDADSAAADQDEEEDAADDEDEYDEEGETNEEIEETAKEEKEVIVEENEEDEYDEEDDYDDED